MGLLGCDGHAEAQPGNKRQSHHHAPDGADSCDSGRQRRQYEGHREGLRLQP